MNSGDITFVTSGGSDEQLVVRLSEGQPVEGGSASAALDPVQGTLLDSGRIADILSRLPDWQEDPNDRQEFNRPAETLAPPLTGETIETSFPANGDGEPPAANDGPLEVLRVQPEGDVGLAPFVSITFNQPMVPLGTLGQLDALDVPATITPAVPGHWEWIGTRTLRFESDAEAFDRLPMATEYRVDIPAGTTSQSGNELDAAVSFIFATPPANPERISSFTDAMPLEPVFVVTFDQLVDAESALANLTLTADGDVVALRMATAAEVDADDDARGLASRTPDGRWVAVRATAPLPTDAGIVLAVGTGVASAEGPLLSTETAAESGQTYAPLRITDWECGWDRCVPFAPIDVRFNNPLDFEAFDQSMVTVTPAIAGMTVSASWQNISISGNTVGQTDYEITISGEVTDIFGQRLGEDVTRTISVGSADPFLGQFGRDIAILDPMADDPALSLPTINHGELQVSVYRVDSSDYSRYQDYVSSFYDDRPGTPPGEQIGDFRIQLDSQQDELTFADIGLGDYLDSGLGQLVVVVEPTGELARLDRDDDLWWSNRPTAVWAQGTHMSVDSFSDGREVLVWATDLRTGEPLAGVSVDLLGRDGSVASLTTDAEGLARAGLDRDGNVERMVASLDDDTALFRSDAYGNSFDDQVRWYVADDRGLYKPGESVRAKGWVRELTISTDGQLQLVDGQQDVQWTAYDAQGNDIASGTADVSVLGGFDLQFDIPEGANLGSAWIDLSISGGIRGSNTNHNYQIQEFRRPEFEVSARTESPGPYYVTDPATVAVDAEYFAGGPLPDAPVDWNVTTRTATYRPPNWDDFTFGFWTAWWWDDFGDGYYADDYYYDDFCCFDGADEVEVFSGVTDASGSHYLQMTFEAASAETRRDRPSTVTANAAVMDVNRQTWAASTSLLVHSGRYYVGLDGRKPFVRKGEALEIDVIVVDVDGEPVVGRSVEVVAQVLEWQVSNGEWGEVAVSEEVCTITTSAEAQTCSFGTELGGRYQVSSVVTDDNGGMNRTEMTRWISGGQARPSTRVEQQTAELVPDQETYQPGDVAEILVQSPFGAAEGLLILSRNGMQETRTFTIEQDTTILSIPIEDRHVPNLGVQVELVGTAARIDRNGDPIAGVPDRPAFASGALTLRIPPLSRTLDVTATPAQDAVEPGADTSVDVQVRDAAGNPVQGAELLLVVVDEAVLALSDYQLADPIDMFYSDLRTYLSISHGRDLVRLTDSSLLNLEAGGVDTDDAAGDTGGGEFSDEAMEESAAEGDFATADAAAPVAPSSRTLDGGAAPIDVRSNFDALAVFAPELITDASGNATVDFTMPDSLTRYRVMVVAVDGGDEFGSNEANITARLPLMVRPSAPRFLNFGDQFELPVVVQNQTDQDMEVEVVMQASNLTLANATDSGVAGQLVTVPANNRIEVRFPASAEDVGTARFRVAAVSGSAADAATIDLPVYTPATTEAFATYGVVDGGTADSGVVFQPVLGPEGVIPQFGGLEVNTSSTALQALTDAVIYINDYEYRSSDAAASRILSISSLRDVLSAFQADGLPSEAEMNASVTQSIDTIVGLQNDDGGFPYWRRNRESIPYNSVHVVHALVVARDNGFAVPQNTLDSALFYLQDIESYYPSWYSQESRDTVSAYALHVRDLAGSTDRNKATDLWNRRGENLSLDAIAWLWPVLGADTSVDAEIERIFNNRTTETAGAATFVNSYSDDDYVLLHSNRRTDGIVLQALITERPSADLIPKVVQGLLAGKSANGRWGNIQENTFILLALNDYFAEFEDITPDFVARVWLGDLYAAEHVYEGRTTDRNETLIPMAELVAQGDTDVVLQKDGDGRLYYRLGLNYAPENFDLDPLDRGFVVQRTYEAVNDPSDVVLGQDGVWRIKAGAEVRVRLTMTADSRRTHVALVDPLPAGLEILNPALAVTEDLPRDNGGSDEVAGYSWYWWWNWFEHQNLRDDRAEAFTSWLSAGTYDYSYVARATTPGTFVVPPPKAEEMYAPETFGRGASDTVIVEG